MKETLKEVVRRDKNILHLHLNSVNLAPPPRACLLVVVRKIKPHNLLAMPHLNREQMCAKQALYILPTMASRTCTRDAYRTFSIDGGGKHRVLDQFRDN